MTLTELQAKRDDILKSAEIARITFSDRSIEYARQKDALELIDREIAKLTSPERKVFTIQTSRGL